MSQIGSFTLSNDGTYTGTIKTLTIDAKARFIPSDAAATSDKAPDLRATGENAPSHRVVVGRADYV